jgi:IS30 family transposase
MYHQLTEAERYALPVLKRGGHSCRSIARIMDRDPSTISEI